MQRNKHKLFRRETQSFWKKIPVSNYTWTFLDRGPFLGFCIVCLKNYQ